MMKKSILFVCDGNTFRSISAEYALKKYLAENKISGWKISSAGIIAKQKPMHLKTIAVLKKLGIKTINHKPRKLTKKMLNDYDVIIAFAENQVNFINSKFGGKKVLLFKELADGEKSSIWDVEDDVKDYKTNKKAVEKKIENTIKDIFKKIPRLFKTASERYYLFSDFVAGLIFHRNGFPFIKLHETKNSVSFMSVDIPSKEDGHILVIPKKRYVDFSEIPKNVLSELMGAIQKIGTAIKINHGGYNILLNNGADAGQYIFHAHFHIIPRKYNDGIKIEAWNHKNINLADFVKLNNKLLKQMKSIKSRR